MTNSVEKIAVKTSLNSIVVNIVLSLFKFVAGIIGNSAAMLSDAVHTLSDVLSTIIVILGVKLAGKESDKSHPYGHERMECVAAILLAALLFATGIGIGYSGVMKIIGKDFDSGSIPGTLALAAAIVSIVVKEAMYWYTRAAAKRTNSSALMADAWHHRSDAFSSVGSFAGILGARIGFPILDPLACVVICLLIIQASFSIFMDSIGKMMDKACDDSLVGEMRTVILGQDGVASIDLLYTRIFGDKIYVDVEISTDGDASLNTAHGIAHKVHDTIEASFPKVKHCMVHINPSNNE